jgi:sugar phosphate isomerase/epimerase
LRIALYPHDGLWLQTTDDAVRVAARTGRYNVGVTFNLCHWMKSRPRPPFDAVLHRAMPRLMLMTINGADSDSRRWSDLIRPLGQGDFPIENLLVTLDQMEYDGPIGLQTYGILGDERARLARSIEVWRELTGRVSGQTDGDRPVTEPRRDERISDGQEGEEEDPDAQPARPEAAPTVGRGAQAGG